MSGFENTMFALANDAVNTRATVRRQRYQRRLAQLSAEQQQQQLDAADRDEKTAARRREAAIRARYAAAGIDAGEGSALSLLRGERELSRRRLVDIQRRARNDRRRLVLETAADEEDYLHKMWSSVLTLNG